MNKKLVSSILAIIMLILTLSMGDPVAAVSRNDRVSESEVLERQYIDLPSVLSDEPMQEIEDWSIPCITRFMETDWENEKKDQNITTAVAIPSWAVVLLEDEPSDHQDLNYTVDNNCEYIIQEIPPPAAQIESEPQQSGNLMTPLTFAKKGHYFPFTGYSKMYFDFEADSWWGAQYRIHLEIARAADTYARTLTVSLDGSQFYSCIIGSTGFHDDIWTPIIWWGGVHTIRIQINWGAYVEKAWKLEYFWVYNTADIPLDVKCEYTHQSEHSKMEYLVETGPNTILNLKTENGWDGITRSCFVYLDSRLVFMGSSPGNYEISLGDFPDGEIHQITIDIFSCSSTEYAKKITVMLVHHDGASLEIDYRYDHQPDSEALEYLETFFKTHSYHRVDCVLDQSLSSSVIPDTITQNFDWWSVKSQYFSHLGHWTEAAGDVDWLWCVFVHYIEGNAGFYGGDTIAVADQAWIDWCNQYGYSISWQRRAVLMHEFGHYLGMPHYIGETTCPNYPCVFSAGAPVEAPTYCLWHWLRGAYYETVWHDPCSSTSTWTRVYPADGFETYRTLDISGNLYSQSGYLYCSGIQSSSEWKHGPLFIKTLPTSIPLCDLRALEAILELSDTPNRMGDLVVILYDENKELSMVFCLYDSWYSSTSRAYLDYWRIGTTHDEWYEGSHSNSWIAKWRFWFDPHPHTAWSLKSELDDDTPQSHTHFTTPAGERNRLIKYIGLQFARASTYTFHSSDLRVLNLRLWYHFDTVTNPMMTASSGMELETLTGESIQTSYAMFLPVVTTIKIPNALPLLLSSKETMSRINPG
nr:MAG: hypothetical protein AM325_12515 [Candidatus Thorarchaeota archaeon SMTZ1-45]